MENLAKMYGENAKRVGVFVEALLDDLVPLREGVSRSSTGRPNRASAWVNLERGLWVNANGKIFVPESVRNTLLAYFHLSRIGSHH